MLSYQLLTSVAILLATLTCQLEAAGSSSGSSDCETFDKINDLLVERLPDDLSLDRNLEKAREILSEEQQRKDAGPSAEMIEALKKFSNLQYAIDPDTFCSKEAVAALKANMNSIYGSKKSSSKRRIDAIYTKIVDHHIAVCPDLYDQMRSHAMIKLDSVVKRFVRLFLDKAIRDPKLDDMRLAREISDYTLIEDPRHAYNAIATMNTLADKDSKVALLKAELIVRQLYDEHIVKNCLKFLEAGDDVYYVYELDSFAKHSGPQPSEEFKIDYNRFWYCDQLVNWEKEVFFDTIIKTLQKHANKAAGTSLVFASRLSE